MNLSYLLCYLLQIIRILSRRTQNKIGQEEVNQKDFVKELHKSFNTEGAPLYFNSKNCILFPVRRLTEPVQSLQGVFSGKIKALYICRATANFILGLFTGVPLSGPRLLETKLDPSSMPSTGLLSRKSFIHIQEELLEATWGYKLF